MTGDCKPGTGTIMRCVLWSWQKYIIVVFSQQPCTELSGFEDIDTGSFCAPVQVGHIPQDSGGCKVMFLKDLERFWKILRVARFEVKLVKLRRTRQRFSKGSRLDSVRLGPIGSIGSTSTLGISWHLLVLRSLRPWLVWLGWLGSAESVSKHIQTLADGSIPQCNGTGGGAPRTNVTVVCHQVAQGRNVRLPTWSPKNGLIMIYYAGFIKVVFAAFA